MKVKDMIAKLQEFDPELPVCVADWNEECRDPCEYYAEVVGIKEGKFWSKDQYQLIEGKFVCIG